MKHLLCCLLFVLSTPIHFFAQEAEMYRLVLTDKGNAGFSIDRPEEFLSPKSIERREKQGFVIDESDLPIDPEYFAILTALGAEVRTCSKWVNTIVVKVDDPDVIPRIRELPFVKEASVVWREVLPPGNRNKPNSKYKVNPSSVSPQGKYGSAYTQINLINGIPLHSMGYQGEGMSIAVLDGGFNDSDRIRYFDHTKIREAKDFTHENIDPYRDFQAHGTNVLSCMLANSPRDMVGTAPGADYYLFKTEVNAEEYPVEEDYWVAALEYADSLGMDIVSTSLGYYNFDDPSMDHTHDQLNGQTVPASRAGSIAARKGMILCNSAGNEGNNAWQKIVFPSDAGDILTVGGVDAQGNLSLFSSIGYFLDDKVKPDVVSLGTNVTVIDSWGIRTGSGTSFSCPLISGMTACLWQALPELNSLQIMDIIKKSAHRFTSPDPYYGNGIPDYQKAYELGKDIITSIPSLVEEESLSIQYRENRLYLSREVIEQGEALLTIYSVTGNTMMQQVPQTLSVNLDNLEKGMYIVLLQWNGNRVAKKFIK